MKKTVVIIILSLVVGALLGACGHWYFTDYIQQVKLDKAAMAQQEKLNQMVRTGKVVNVKPNELTLKVEISGDKKLEGKEITVKTNKDTSIQEDSNFLSEPGTAFDLTSKLKKGMNVNLMVQGENAVAVYWESRHSGDKLKN